MIKPNYSFFQRSAPSRIIVVSSVTHIMGQIKVSDLNFNGAYDPLEAYNQSKLANILFVKELAKRLANSGVTVNAVNPGFVDTQITRYLGTPRFVLLILLLFVGMSPRIAFTNSVWCFCRQVFRPFYRSPKSGAQTTLFAALEPALTEVTGQFFRWEFKIEYAISKTKCSLYFQ